MSYKVNLMHLYTFYVVAQKKSMLEAAHFLCISPPAVSMQIKRIEESLGYKLFIRKKTEIELSSQGESLYPLLVECFEKVSNIEDMMYAMMPEQRQNINLTIHKTPAEFFVSKIMKEKNKNHNLKLQIVDDEQGHILQTLKEGRTDIAILQTALPFIIPKVDFNDTHMQEVELEGGIKLVLKKLSENDIILVCGSKNKDIKNLKSLKEIEKISLIGQTKNAPLSAILDDFFLEKGIKANFAIHEVPTFIAKKILQESEHAAFLPMHLVQDEIKLGTLKQIHITSKLPSLTYYFTYMKNSPNKNIIDEFLKPFNPVEI